MNSNTIEFLLNYVAHSYCNSEMLLHLKRLLKSVSAFLIFLQEYGQHFAQNTILFFPKCRNVSLRFPFVDYKTGFFFSLWKMQYLVVLRSLSNCIRKDILASGKFESKSCLASQSRMKKRRNFHVEAFTDLMTSYIDIPWIFNGSIVAAAKNYHKIFEENCICSTEKGFYFLPPFKTRKVSCYKTCICNA